MPGCRRPHRWHDPRHGDHVAGHRRVARARGARGDRVHVGRRHLQPEGRRERPRAARPGPQGRGRERRGVVPRRDAARLRPGRRGHLAPDAQGRQPARASSRPVAPAYPTRAPSGHPTGARCCSRASRSPRRRSRPRSSRGTSPPAPSGCSSRRTRQPAGVGDAPTYSPDGATIAYTYGRYDRNHPARDPHDAGGRRTGRDTDQARSGPSYSPDGTRWLGSCACDGRAAVAETRTARNRGG